MSGDCILVAIELEFADSCGIGGGIIVLFDRKMLRNFRKDGHNWKNKKDGKTIKEAHEHLKVNFLYVSEFVCAFVSSLLQLIYTFFVISVCWSSIFRSREHIVLVYYREIHEVQTAPATPGNSYSSSITDHLSPKIVAEDTSSGVHNACNTGFEVCCKSLGSRNHEIRLHEINTLDWDELLIPADISNQSHPTEEYLQTAPRGSAKQVSEIDVSSLQVALPVFLFTIFSSCLLRREITSRVEVLEKQVELQRNVITERE
ncbi:unnamed protein product, partial [Arabidopsis halleri]